MAKPSKTCPLCPPTLGSDEHDLVYYEYQETRDFARAAQKATELGAPATEEEARAHFQYHRTVQPPPRGYLKRPKALIRANELPERLQNMLILISRVKALSASQLAELFYWTGAEEQLASARNACYRDLRRLILDDFAYRFYPDSSVLGGKRTDQLSLYFLGRDATPFIEEREEVELTRRDFVSSVDQLSDETRVLQWHESAEALCSLVRQVKQMEAAGHRPGVQDQRSGNVARFAVSFQPSNWFGAGRMAMSFIDPVGQVDATINPEALAAVGLSMPEKGFSVLAPFFYEYDPGTRSAQSVAEGLLDYLALRRSGALADRFPQLPRRDYFPPILVVCSEVRRVIALQEEISGLLRKRNIGAQTLPVAIITDEVTLAHHGVAGQAWLSLWESGFEAKRYRLVEALLQSCGPLVGQLSATSTLKYRASV